MINADGNGNDHNCECSACAERYKTLQAWGARHVAINKLRDEMAAAYRFAEQNHHAISRAKMLEFINAINSLC